MFKKAHLDAIKTSLESSPHAAQAAAIHSHLASTLPAEGSPAEEATETPTQEVNEHPAHAIARQAVEKAKAPKKTK